MRCPHCSLSIHFEEREGCLRYTDDATKYGFGIVTGSCPNCHKKIVLLRWGNFLPPVDIGGGGKPSSAFSKVFQEEFIYPRCSGRGPLPADVPEYFRADFEEAAAVSNLSPKASAALSRRLLQRTLRENLHVQPATLSKEIDEFLQKTGIPPNLGEAVDAVRIIGNFAAHPLKDKNTGEITDVEPGEADWLLDVLDALADFVFIQPKKLEYRKQKLNEKLQALGKPPLK